MLDYLVSITMWKDIVGFEDRYEISDSGEVRNKKTQKILTLKVDRDGYYQIGLRKQGDRKKFWFYIHRLVAVYYIHSDNTNGLQIDHIDHNKLNNNVDNLRWVTCLENNLARELKTWASNKTTGELYITRYRNGYMVRINRSDFKRRYWSKSIDDAISKRDEFLEELRS